MEEKKAAVIGFPIKHSLSPRLHNFWLKTYGLNGDYSSIEVKPEDLESFLLNLEKAGLKGINITVPHKEAAFEILQNKANISEVAQKIGALNTVYLENGEIYGTNTDYYGFKQAILRDYPDFTFENKKILVIGAGGAAKAIAGGLSLEKTGGILVVNRSAVKLQEMQKKLNNQIDISGLDNLEEKINACDLIINATSCGLNGENNLKIDFTKIVGSKVFYDIVYKPLKTKFLSDAEQNNHKIITGINMLLYQAVPAFDFFFGKRPEVTAELQAEMLK